MLAFVGFSENEIPVAAVSFAQSKAASEGSGREELDGFEMVTQKVPCALGARANTGYSISAVPVPFGNDDVFCDSLVGASRQGFWLAVDVTVVVSVEVTTCVVVSVLVSVRVELPK